MYVFHSLSSQISMSVPVIHVCMVAVMTKSMTTNVTVKTGTTEKIVTIVSLGFFFYITKTRPCNTCI